jgi:Uma2 family endonuclease
MTLMSTAPVPDWLIPPERGFEAADLDHLPDLPPHTELIDGSLILVSPQADFHTLVLSVLEAALRRTAPPELRVRREMTVTLGPRQRPEPDVIVIHAEAVKDSNQTTYVPDDVVLAIEVVSPESRLRDRERKPLLYAKAGIGHFWLVENEQGKPVLHTFVLDRALESYVPTGIHEDLVRLSLPYPIEIDFSEIDRL